jgi:DNA repair exonuclease SbcCD ATPase subunit
MSDDDIDDQDSPRQAKQDAPPPPDERDAIIERLERTVAEERKNSAKLRNTVEDLRFKAEILEKSYAKQLADARQRSATAEQHLADQTALETSREETMRQLNETRAELERVTIERDQLLEQPGRSDAPRPRIRTVPRGDSGSQAAEGTINELMANLRFTRERPPPEDSHLHSHARADEECPSEEMIAPDLVFPKKRDSTEES